MALRYQLTDWWRLSGSYTYFDADLDLESASMDPTGGATIGNDPHHMAKLRSAVDLPGNLELNVMMRYVDRLPEPHVPSYLGLDVLLAWYPISRLEVAVVGQNLLDDRHPEAGAEPARSEVERGFYGKLTWRF